VLSGVFADISKDSTIFYGLQSLGQNLAFIHGSLNQLMPIGKQSLFISENTNHDYNSYEKLKVL
jgi:hypothetical protein